MTGLLWTMLAQEERYLNAPSAYGKNATRFGALPTCARPSDRISPLGDTSTRCSVPSPMLLKRTWALLSVPGIGSMQHGLDTSENRLRCLALAMSNASTDEGPSLAARMILPCTACTP